MGYSQSSKSTNTVQRSRSGEASRQVAATVTCVTIHPSLAEATPLIPNQTICVSGCKICFCCDILTSGLWSLTHYCLCWMSEELQWPQVPEVACEELVMRAGSSRVHVWMWFSCGRYFGVAVCHLRYFLWFSTCLASWRCVKSFVAATNLIVIKCFLSECVPPQCWEQRVINAS